MEIKVKFELTCPTLEHILKEVLTTMATQEQLNAVKDTFLLKFDELNSVIVDERSQFVDAINSFKFVIDALRTEIELLKAEAGDTLDLTVLDELTVKFDNAIAEAQNIVTPSDME